MGDRCLTSPLPVEPCGRTLWLCNPHPISPWTRMESASMKSAECCEMAESVAVAVVSPTRVFIPYGPRALLIWQPECCQRVAASATTDVQKAHRRAAMGMSLRHSGHFFVVGSGAASPRRIRAKSLLTGRTIKK
jgi:hypothetical protein